MRKRRVLAALLAFSLVVSGNGMSVLAAETGAGEPVITLEETSETGVSSGVIETPETGEQEESGTPETGGQQEENEAPDTGESTTPGTNDQTGETETPGTTEEPGESETPGEQETPDAPKEDEASDPVEEQPVEDQEGEPAQEQEETDENDPAVKAYVSRMVTFTDDTGMNVTYDANASTQYVYKVENGVLTAVMMKTGMTENGNAIEEPVKFEGNVELTQPETGEQYTAIAKGVFGGNQDITYVKLPDGVETIGAEAFKGCTALKGVYLPASVKKIETSAFENCTAMTQISIPKAVTAIGDCAFKGDAKLYLVFMKDADNGELKSIGAEAFSGCTLLSQFCSHSAFTFPAKLETVGEAAFRDCKAIDKLDFSANKNLTALGKYAFEGCTGLTDLTPGKILTEIPEGAFRGCNALVCINFVNGKNMTIGREAFKGCYSLKQVVLPQSVVKICEYAFQGCTRLKQVKIDYYNIVIEPMAFPSDAADLVIVAEKDSEGYIYALENKFKVSGEDDLYRYTVEDVNGTLVTDGRFPGGTIWVGTDSSTKPGDEGDINVLNQKKGIKSGMVCYIYREQSDEQLKNYTFIPGSLRCNGQAVEKKEGKYYFKMPAGGAVITAEFRANTPENIVGQKVTVEFSNGTPLQNGATDEYGYRGIELKEGQTSRMFLLDVNGNPIPATKLTKVEASDKGKIVKIDKNGVITAVGTEGKAKASATVTVELRGGDGNKITINRTVSVVAAQAENIVLKASDYTTFVTIEEKADGIQVASIKKNIVEKDVQTIKLKANVYDSEEGISKELTWTSSNTAVAKLESGTTKADNPVNKVTVQKGCEGEATITVTAKNPADAEKEKITQKFVVRVYEEGFRLAASKVTVNPRMEEGAVIELISAYGYGLDKATIQLYEKDTSGATGFTTTYDEKISSATCKRFRIKPITDTMKNGTYMVRVGVNGETNEKNWMPLTITVKAVAPNPTVKFNANKAKFNLFYKNGGTTDKGEQITVVTEITKLGGAKLKDVKLEPLTQKEDDRLFTQNFVIDSVDLAKGKVSIKRSAAPLQYTKNTTKKTAVVKGYLVFYFEGYDDSAAKKVPVTMPTCTTAPSWALRTAKGTYRADAAKQNVSLELYDKKSKKKETVVLDGNYTVEETRKEIAVIGDPSIENGAIVVRFTPEKGRMVLALQNPVEWEQDQSGNNRTLNFTYNVSVSSSKPTIKTKQSSVSLNLNYPEKAAAFELTSNLGGVEIEGTQTFVPKSAGSEIEKLSVTYTDGKGSVSIKAGQRISRGTYKFTCEPNASVYGRKEEGLKTVTLTVKVIDTKPGVKFGKGTLQLNKVVFEKNQSANNAPSEQPKPICQEISERIFTVSGKPEGYTLAPVGSGEEATKVVGKNGNGAERYFDFRVEENPEKEGEAVLQVSLKNASLGKGTYKLQLTPRYQKEGSTTVSAKTVDFQVKVIDTSDIYLQTSAKGKINLVNREGESTDKNGIVYTPTLKNIAGEIEEVKIFDASSLEKESEYFDISVITEGKNAGKFFVTPKKTVKTPQNPGDPIEYTYAELKNNNPYSVKIWVKVKGYAGDDKWKGGVLSKNNITIKTAQVLPKVTLSRTAMDVYLTTKDYNADFVVAPKEGSVGIIDDVYFEEKDKNAKDSFELIKTPQADGSMKVTVHLKEAVSFANGTTNNVKFYVKYKGQGTNTAEKATGFTMKIKVN